MKGSVVRVSEVVMDWEGSPPLKGVGTNKIEVSEPHDVGGGMGGGHTAYNMKGSDGNGEFDVTRRYKEFLVFRETLTKRFPGFFIPPIPEKQVKKKEEKVV
jgi:hypothetical protein